MGRKLAFFQLLGMQTGKYRPLGQQGRVWVGWFRSFLWREIKSSAEHVFPFFFSTQCRNQDQGKISLNANSHSILAFINSVTFSCVDNAYFTVYSAVNIL